MAWPLPLFVERYEICSASAHTIAVCSELCWSILRNSASGQYFYHFLLRHLLLLLLLPLLLHRFPATLEQNAKLSFDSFHRWCVCWRVRYSRVTNKLNRIRWVLCKYDAKHIVATQINFGRRSCMHACIKSYMSANGIYVLCIMCARMRINIAYGVPIAKSKSIDFTSEICIQMHHTRSVQWASIKRWGKRKNKLIRWKRIAKACSVCVCVLYASKHTCAHRTYALHAWVRTTQDE